MDEINDTLIIQIFKVILDDSLIINLRSFKLEKYTY